MKVILHYNDFTKEIDIDCTKKNGVLQENLLNYCSLMIYNIENTELIVQKNDGNCTESIILGSDNLEFNDTLEKLVSEYNILKIIIHERKRDENGNVIKDNNIIDRYNKWYQINEDENYINYINNSTSNLNRHIIRFPLTTLLTNILRVPINELIPENDIPEENNENPVEESSENPEEESSENPEEVSSENPEEVSSENPEEVSSENPEEVSSENPEEESNKNPEEVSSENPEQVSDNQYTQRTNNLNNLINIFDDYMNLSNSFLNESFITRIESEINLLNSDNNLNTFLPNLNEQLNEQLSIQLDGYLSEHQSEHLSEGNRLNIPNNQPIFGTLRQNNTLNQDSVRSLYYILNNNIQVSSFVNYYSPENNTPIQEDVKIVLNDTQFNSLETVIHNDLDQNCSNECLVCLDKFCEDDNIIKIPCNHLFHSNCIKPWLCEESNKCPVCRVEVDKGSPKNI
jgi:hypothetical protein